MAISKMKLINIVGENELLDETLAKFIDTYDFHPVDTRRFIDTVHGVKSLDYNNPYKDLLNQIIDLETKYKLNLKDVKIKKQIDSKEEIIEFVKEAKEKFKVDYEQLTNLENDLKESKDALIHIKSLIDLDISLDDLFNTKYISVRFGKLPKDSYDKLKYYLNKPFAYLEFNQENDFVWFMYITPNDYEREIDNVMSSLFFERVYIPKFVHGKPEEACKKLEERIKELEVKIKEYQEKINELDHEFFDNLSKIKSELIVLNKVYDYKKHVVSLGDKFLISGFVEKYNVEKFKSRFNDLNLDIEVRPSRSDRRLTPPTKLKNNRFFKPFEMFVEMYGLPGYKDMDPTVFLGISYILLYGIMFADFGQGLVLALLGLLLAIKKNSNLGKIMVRIGVSSMIFGIVFGSFFGNETIIKSIFEKMKITFLPINPMDSSLTIKVLLVTLALGIVLILTSIIINIVVKLKQKDYVEAICSHNGFSGIIFYVSALVILLFKLVLHKSVNKFLVLILILVPLLMVFFKEAIKRKASKEKMFPDGVGNFIVEGIFELFEVILSYLSNTLSFLRVGGFVLSHAGMMLVVRVLMEMTGGNILTGVLGNIFVIGLEGLIVGIQVLRLEFYEMFSRYHEGNGIEFKPIN